MKNIIRMKKAEVISTIWKRENYNKY